MNKKATEYYMTLLYIVVVISLTALYFRVDKTTQTDIQLGDLQESILEQTPKLELAQVYLNTAAEQALTASIKELNTYYLTCPTINLEENNEIQTPDILKILNDNFNKQMQQYYAQYKEKTETDLKTTYELYFQENEVIATAEPIEMPIYDKKGLRIGQTTHRPNIKINYNQKFQDYTKINNALTQIARKCLIATNIEECAVQQTEGQDRQIKLQDNKLQIYTALTGQDLLGVCYTLQIPTLTT